MAKEIKILSKDGKENYYPRTKSELVRDSLTGKTVDELIHNNLYDLVSIKSIVGSCRNLNNPNKQTRDKYIRAGQISSYQGRYVTDYIRLYEGIPIVALPTKRPAGYNIYDLNKQYKGTYELSDQQFKLGAMIYTPYADGYIRFSLSSAYDGEEGMKFGYYEHRINYGTEIIDEPYNDKLDDIATDSRVDAVEEKVDDIASTVSSHTTAIQSLESEVSKIDGINKTLQSHSSQITANKESCTISKEKIEELQESLNNHIRKFDEMGEAVLHHSNQISDIEGNVTGHTQQISDIQTSIEDCQQQIENLKGSTPPDTPGSGTSGSTSSADIEALKRTVSEHGTSIQAISSKASGNTEQISQLKTTSEEHGESIASLTTDTQNNAKLIGQLSPKVTANTRTILDQGSQINANTEKNQYN